MQFSNNKLKLIKHNQACWIVQKRAALAWEM